MAFGVFNDVTQGATFVVSLVTLPICTLLTFLRFNSRRRSIQRIGPEDWFAVGAWANFVIYVTLVLIIVCIVNGNPGPPLNRLSFLAKLVYANSLFNWLNQLCAKLCILLLYKRIFSVKSIYRYSIYTIAAIHVGLIVATILVAIFGCTPIAKGWNPLLPGTCVTTAPHPFLAGVESINSAVDFAMVILAMFMIRELNMSMSNKIKVSILFVLGGLAGVIGFVKISQLYATGGGSKSRAVNFTIGLWTIVQQACSIICCCAPIYKSVFPSGELFSRLVSTTSSFWVRTVRAVSGGRSLASRGDSSTKGNNPSQGYQHSLTPDDYAILDGSSQKRLHSAEDEIPFGYDRSDNSTYPLGSTRR